MAHLKEMTIAAAKALVGLYLAAGALCLLALVAWVIYALAWLSVDRRPEFREGVRIHASDFQYARRKRLAQQPPIDLGYAETGNRCYHASGALLLRSAKVQRVLVTFDDPVCSGPVKDGVLRAISAEHLPKRSRFDTAGFWLDRAGERVGEEVGDWGGSQIASVSPVGLVLVTVGSPWPQGFMINCAADAQIYSLRTRLPDPGMGGSKYAVLASVDFRRGSCLDERHWPKIEALIDVIWSPIDYRSGG